MSRQPYQPTQEQRDLVARLTGLLVSEDRIAKDWMKPPCSTTTLRKHFKYELEHGREILVNQLKDGMLLKARQGSIRAMGWLLDRIGDLPPPKRAGDELSAPGPVTIKIIGGLPQTIEGSAVVENEPEPDAALHPKPRPD
jgi:hypothetical protein